ncbi:hypothetical protein [Bacillus altitudinis]|uniref:hypothetical protein n=1 Tax=Bacillus altitudinis TaxID=293387 RepID=UPI002101B75C|nr:hypothetical protein [Bacillus altitudinis]UTV34827.1 hypothetical protein NM966_19735 [Bacillus altitudinis]
MGRIKYTGMNIFTKIDRLKKELIEIRNVIDFAEEEYSGSGVSRLILKREYDEKFKELRELENTSFVTEG